MPAIYSCSPSIIEIIGVFDPPSFNFTADEMGFHDGAIKVIGIGMTATTAKIFSPATLTVLFFEQVSGIKDLFDLAVGDAVVHVTHLKCFIADKLMTGVDIPFGVTAT